MATQLQHESPPPRQPAVQVLDDVAAADVRAFARHYVSILLDLEGVRVTPSTIADSQP